MRNVTITLEDDVARWVRAEADRRETSVSRLVAELLRQQMRPEDTYEAAQRQFFAITPRPLRQGGGPLPSRDELYDRPGLR
jgi:hypothetical protein